MSLKCYMVHPLFKNLPVVRKQSIPGSHNRCEHSITQNKKAYAFVYLIVLDKDGLWHAVNQKNWHTLTTTKDDFGSSFDYKQNGNVKRLDFKNPDTLPAIQYNNIK